MDDNTNPLGHVRPTIEAPPPELVVGPVAVAAAPPARAQLARIGLLGIGAAAILAAAILAFGSVGSPAGTLAADTNPATGDGSASSLNGGPGMPGGRGFGHMFGGIEVTAISGNDISLATEDGWTRTITVDSGTTYSKSGDTIALGDLAVGDQIGFRQTLESNGSWSIDSIAVILPHVGGEVTKVDGSTITVTQRDGSTASITVNGQTRYSVNGNDGATLSDVKVGMFLVAEGTKNSDGSLTATTIKAGNVRTTEGRGGRFGRGFPFGPGPDWNGDEPGSSAAPSATGTAS
jgi:uncharacterized protein DUF5666